MPSKTLALFDLDHTLVAFDSGTRWLQFLVARGELAPTVLDAYLDYCRQYLAGTLDIRAMHRYAVRLLAPRTVGEIAALAAEFGDALRADIAPARLALVQRHVAAGDRCAIVTATTRFVAAPVAARFDGVELVCTEPQVDASGDRYTGEVDGEPCFGAHKVGKVDGWLARRGQARADFDRVVFYSDSFNDLPLLRAATDPVAVTPDPRLAQLAAAHGWPVIDDRPAYPTAGTLAP